MSIPSESRIVLVTGASRGIGLAATRALIARGATVIGTARSAAALEDAVAEFGAAFVPFVVEMSDKAGLNALAAMIASRFGRLDALFGNAGILGTFAPLGALADDDFEKTVAINITSSYRLLHLFDPLLRKSKAGRVLFVTSGAAWKRHAEWTLYVTSKAFIEALLGVYAREVANTTIRANLISPGPIRTEMRVVAWPKEDPMSVPPPEAVAPVIADLLGPATTENGGIYDYPLGRWTYPQRPA